MLRVLERECPDLSEAIEQSSEKQELWATLMESKRSLQKVAPEEFQKQIFQELKEVEEQKSKEALELLGRKHKLFRGGRRRGRMCFYCCHRQFLLLFLPRKSSSIGKERDWWSADLEGEMENLEVEGSCSLAEG